MSSFKEAQNIAFAEYRFGQDDKRRRESSEKDSIGSSDLKFRRQESIENNFNSPALEQPTKNLNDQFMDKDNLIQSEPSLMVEDSSAKMLENDDKPLAAVSTDEQTVKRQIELNEGQAISNMMNSENKIYVTRYRGWKGVLWFLADVLVHFDHLVLIIHFNFLFFYPNEPNIILPSVVLFISLITRVAFTVAYHYQLRHAQELVNNKPVHKFFFTRKYKSFQEVTWKTLQIGDLIRVYKNQEVPCDALVLDIRKSKTKLHHCEVIGNGLSDELEKDTKQSFQGTQNKTGQQISDSKLVQQISGLVKWEYNSKGHIAGSFKLSENPAAFEFSSQNVVFRGSYVKGAESIVCLVLNVGSNCANSIFRQNSRRMSISTLRDDWLSFHFKAGPASLALRTIQIVTFILFICLAALVTFLENQFLEEQKDMQHSLQNFAAILVPLLQGYPYLCHLCLETIMIVHSFFVKWDVQLAAANVKFNNLLALKQFQVVNDLVVNRKTVMQTNKCTIQSFKLSSKFLFENEVDSQMLARINLGIEVDKPELGNSDSDSNSNEESRKHLDYLPNVRLTSYLFKSLKLKHRFATNRESDFDKEFSAFFKALVICQAATFRVHAELDTNEGWLNKKFKAERSEEVAQLMLAEQYGYSFLKRKKKILTISCNKQTKQWEEIIYFQAKVSGKTVVIQLVRPHKDTNEKAILFFKGPLSVIKKVSKRQFHEELDQEQQRLCMNGQHAFAIAQREIDPEEADFLERKIEDLSNERKKQHQLMQTFLLKLSFDLKLVGIFGLKNEVSLRNSLLLQKCFANNVRVWLVSQDDDLESLTDVNAMGFLTNKSFPINIKCSTEKNVDDQIKQGLKVVTERLLNKQKDQPQGTTPKRRKRSPSKKQSRSKKDKSPKYYHKNKLEAPTVFFNGQALAFILKDENMLKSFLTLCTLCQCMVGSNLTADQKGHLVREIRDFNHKGQLGFTVGVAQTRGDQYLATEADVSIGVKSKFQKSDIRVACDIKLTDFSAISSLLFKHSVILKRRKNLLVKQFEWRTLLLFIINFFFCYYGGWQGSVAFKTYYIAVLVSLISPVSFISTAISDKQYSYHIIGRIFGEYKNNWTEPFFQAKTCAFCYLNALGDSVIFLSFYLMQIASRGVEMPLDATTAQVLSEDSFLCYNGLALQIILLFHLRETNGIVSGYNMFHVFLFTLGCAFVLQDEKLVGITSLLQSPTLLLNLAFVTLWMMFKRFCQMVYNNALPTSSKKRIEFYKNIEEFLLHEEFEDPEMRFFVQNEQNLDRAILQQKLYTINQNMVKLHRSDSLDQILEKINLTGQDTSKKSAISNVGVINKFNLKLIDINKELEYNNQGKDRKLLQYADYQIRIFMLMNFLYIVYFIALLLFGNFQPVGDLCKMPPGKQTEDSPFKFDVLVQQQTCFRQTSFSFAEVTPEIVQIILGLVVIYGLRKTQARRPYKFVLGYVIAVNVITFVMVFLNPESNLQFWVYFAVLNLTFGCRTVYVFTTLVCGLIQCILFLNMTITKVEKFSFSAFALYNTGDLEVAQAELEMLRNHNYWFRWQICQQMMAYLLYFALWAVSIYISERNLKIEFVNNFRKIREYQKLKSIMNLLLPSLVRDRIKEGQKNFSDSQGEVTIVFCDIEGFDELVQMYTGKELLEMMDNIYNAFDQLCEQFGLSKIETVGKTYMACGGLKFFEQTIDQRLLGSHPSVRVLDFCFEVRSYASGLMLPNGQRLSMKIGVHTGEVISGVVGETKPQFSLIGDTVNKTSRVCSKCPKAEILISKETQHLLEHFSNNFSFTEQEVEMKGIGLEKVYVVQKRKSPNRFGKDSTKNDRTHLLRSMSSNLIAKEEKKVYESDSAAEQDSALDKKGGKTSNDTFNNSTHQVSAELSHERLNKRLELQEFRDEDKIVTNPTLNEKYKLVERPKWLLQFDLKDVEGDYISKISQLNQNEIIFYLFNKLILDCAVLVDFCLNWFDKNKLLWLLLILPLFVALELLIFCHFRLLKPENAFRLQLWVVPLIAIEMAVIIYKGLAYFPDDSTNQKHTSRVYLVMMLFICLLIKSLPVRLMLIYTAIFAASFLVFDITALLIENQFDFWGFSEELIRVSCIATQLYFVAFAREMSFRKKYNRERILAVETERTHELLQKLVPVYVLEAIKNDERVVDDLSNVTLLFTDMVGFTAFSNNVKKPEEVLKLLSQLFSKFDQLCEARDVYKVHTIGDCYVIMGYTGRIPKSSRSRQICTEEAHKVLQVGLEMIEIITEVRSASEDPNLKNLDMRIGIHSGRVIAGMIGSKLVRYDIFGQDVLVANKMESNGVGGKVCISENTFELLQHDPSIAQKYIFSEHTTLEIQAHSLSIQSYLVEPKLLLNFNSDQSINNIDITSQLSDSYSSESGNVSLQLINEEEPIQDKL